MGHLNELLMLVTNKGPTYSNVFEYSNEQVNE